MCSSPHFKHAIDEVGCVNCGKINNCDRVCDDIYKNFGSDEWKIDGNPIDGMVCENVNELKDCCDGVNDANYKTYDSDEWSIDDCANNVLLENFNEIDQIAEVSRVPEKKN